MAENDENLEKDHTMTYSCVVIIEMTIDSPFSLKDQFHSKSGVKVTLQGPD